MHRIHEDVARRNSAEARAWAKVRRLEKEVEQMNRDRPTHYFHPDRPKETEMNDRPMFYPTKEGATAERIEAQSNALAYLRTQVEELKRQGSVDRASYVAAAAEITRLRTAIQGWAKHNYKIEAVIHDYRETLRRIDQADDGEPGMMARVALSDSCKVRAAASPPFDEEDREIYMELCEEILEATSDRTAQASGVELATLVQDTLVARKAPPMREKKREELRIVKSRDDVVDRLRLFCDPDHAQDPHAREAMADAWVEIEKLRKAEASPPILPKMVAWPEGHASDVTRAAFLETLDKGEKQ